MNAHIMPDIRLTPPNISMITGYVVLAFGVSVLVAAANSAGTAVYDQFVLLTLAGSVVASSIAFLLNADQEKVTVVIGRAFFSAVCGVVGTRVAAHNLEWAAKMIGADQVLVFGFGFVLGLVGFIIAVALVRSSHRRASSVVNKQLDRFLPDDRDDNPPTKQRHSRPRKKNNP